MAADVNLSAATFTPYKIANETLATNNTTTGAGANLGTTFFDITNSTNSDLDVVMTTGFVGAVTGTTDYYVRVDLTNAAYATAAQAMTVLPAGIGPGGGGTSTLFSGGTVGSSSAIYQFDITATTPATATLATAFTDLATNGNPTVKMSIFETLTEANKGAAGTPVVSASKQIAAISPGITSTVTAAAVNAEVSTDFKQIAGTPTTKTITLGTTVNATTGFVDASQGTTATLTDLYTTTTSIATITGDMSNGDWWVSGTAACADVTVPTADKLTLNAAKTSGTVTLARLTPAASILCNRTDGVAVIPKSSYTIGIDFAPGNTLSAGAADYTGVLVGTVGRNGTTQEINYLTTFASYNQRVYITNRGTTDATYAFTFQSEAGVTATAGTAATGTSKAGSVLALKAADIVTLTGKTRTGATLTIVGTPALFSVSTQQVNLSNGATDTVVYK
jgi:hypothetical protein